MNLTCHLRGRLVALDPLTPDHREVLVSAANESGANYDYTAVPTDEESAAGYIRSALADQANGFGVPFVIRDLSRGRIVGSTRYLDLAYWNEDLQHERDRRRPSNAECPSVAEIGGTWLAASAQGTGVNTETKLLMLNHAFEVWGVQRVSFKTDVRNQRSRRAIERIGASFEGVRRAHLRTVDGRIRDTAYYSIIASEWPQVKRSIEARLRVSSTGDPGPSQ